MRKVMMDHLLALFLGIAAVHGGETSIVQKESVAGREADRAVQSESALPELRVTFATLATSEAQAIQVARCIRHSGGVYARCPVWIFFCERMPVLTPSTQLQLEDLRISVIRFRPDICVDRVPFALKVCAAACAEALAERSTDLLWWIDVGPTENAAAATMDRSNDRTPGPGGLSPEKELDRIIGSGCPILDSRLKSTRDLLTIRSYLDSGSLVVRPENGLLRLWREILKEPEGGPVMVPVPDERKDSEFLARR